MTLDQIIENEQTIREAITRSYVDPTGKALPVYDGVVDATLYSTAPSRILWILKEPWDQPDCSGGGWSITQDLLNQQSAKMAKGHTFQPIIYVTYGIFNRVWSRHDMPSISAAPEMALLLRSIAFINAKKLPGLKRSNDRQILDSYHVSREVILQQINSYKPDYVFGCRPHMSASIADLGVGFTDIRTHGKARYARIGSSLYFDVFHPAQSRISRARYIDDILHVVAAETA